MKVAWLFACIGVAVATTYVDNTAEIPLDLSRFCSGGGAFGLYERQTGCALNNCECFPVFFTCNKEMANGLGECTLSGMGHILLFAAFIINLVVPGIYFLSHFYHEDDPVDAKTVIEEERSSRRPTLDHKPSVLSDPSNHKEDTPLMYFDMIKFRKAIPDKVYGLDKTAKLKLETMSKGYIQFIFFFMLLAFVLCMSLFVGSSGTNETAYKFTTFNASTLDGYTYKLDAMATHTTFPQGMRFLSLHGDFCRIHPTPGIHAVSLNYRAHARVDKNLLFDHFYYDDITLLCKCSTTSCQLYAASDEDPAAPDIGLYSFLSIPWYQDAFQVIGHEVNHTVHFKVAIRMNTTLLSAPELTLVAHHARLERVIEIIKWIFLLCDVLALGYWSYINRKRRWVRMLPERRLLYISLICNALGSSPMIHFTQAFLSSTWSYLFAQAWAAALSGAWLLSLLIAIDLQRQRTFRCSFFALKCLLVVLALTMRTISFYTMPTNITSLIDLFLAAMAMIIFRGVMMSVRNHMRLKPYAASRPEQLTARVLYFIAILVTYVYFFSALFADPVPEVKVYLANSRVLTNLPIQIMSRAATLVLFLIFLPVNNKKMPQLLATTMVFTRENSLFTNSVHKSVRVPKKKPNKIQRLFSSHNSFQESQAPSIFCLETACQLYNLSCHAYYGIPDNKNEPSDVDMDVAAVERDGLVIIKELYDAPTDTHAMVFKDDKRFFVAFRGTNSRQNAITDINYNFCKPAIFVDKFPDLRLHSGFYIAYMSIREQLIELLAEYRELTWYITGHSLGGALATVAAFDLTANYAMDNVVMYNYGSPRVGNHVFASAYNVFVPRTFRVVNDADVIVGGPKQAVFGMYCVSSLRYKHIGTPVLLSDRASGTFLIDPNIVEMAFIAKLRSNGFSHLLSAYRLKLAKGLKATLADTHTAMTETTPLSVA